MRVRRLQPLQERARGEVREPLRGDHDARQAGVHAFLAEEPVEHGVLLDDQDVAEVAAHLPPRDGRDVAHNLQGLAHEAAPGGVDGLADGYHAPDLAPRRGDHPEGSPRRAGERYHVQQRRVDGGGVREERPRRRG